MYINKSYLITAFLIIVLLFYWGIFIFLEIEEENNLNLKTIVSKLKILEDRIDLNQNITTETPTENIFTLQNGLKTIAFVVTVLGLIYFS